MTRYWLEMPEATYMNDFTYKKTIVSWHVESELSKYKKQCTPILIQKYIIAYEKTFVTSYIYKVLEILRLTKNHIITIYEKAKTVCIHI